MSPSSDQCPVIGCDGKSWCSLAAHSLTSRYGVRDPVDGMRIAAAQALSHASEREPPTDLGLVGSMLGVVRVVEMDMRCAARLRPVREGYVIELNTGETRGRRRFSHGHEIGHVLVPDESEHTKQRQDDSTGYYGQQHEEEYLCDIAAAELLMPMPAFRSAASQNPLGVRGVPVLADQFDVSLEAAAIRLTQCDLGDCAAIVWEEDYKKSQLDEMANQVPLLGMENLGPRPRLRVRFAVTSPGMGEHYFPRQKSVDDDCLICRSLSTDALVTGECHLPTGRGPVRFQTESVRAPYRREGQLRARVISLVTPV